MSPINNNISLAALESVFEALQENNTLIYLSYEQFGLKIPKSLVKAIDDKLAENVRLRLGVSMAEFKEDHLRYIKHDRAVRNIDSIYRNRSCTLQH